MLFGDEINSGFTGRVIFDPAFLYEAISKMPFGPFSLLVPCFKSSKYRSIPPVYDPQRGLNQAGNPALRGNVAPPRK